MVSSCGHFVRVPQPAQGGGGGGGGDRWDRSATLKDDMANLDDGDTPIYLGDKRSQIEKGSKKRSSSSRGQAPGAFSPGGAADADADADADSGDGGGRGVTASGGYAVVMANAVSGAAAKGIDIRSCLVRVYKPLIRLYQWVRVPGAGAGAG